MTRPFGLPEKRLLVTVPEERPRRPRSSPDHDPAPPADAVSTREVAPDEWWYALDWMGAGPEEQPR